MGTGSLISIAFVVVYEVADLKLVGTLDCDAKTCRGKFAACVYAPAECIDVNQTAKLCSP